MPDKAKKAQSEASVGRVNIVAGVLAALLPGLGHFYLGQTKRAVLAAVGVLGLFFGGVFIGGIDVVDAKEDKWWFLGQAFVGPIALGTDWVHQNHYKLYDVGATATSNPIIEAREMPARFRTARPDEKRIVGPVTVRNWEQDGRKTDVVIDLPYAVPAGEGEGPPNRKSVAKVNEIGTLYALCAGMMNLIAILDALIPTRAPGHDERNKRARAAAQRREEQADDKVHPEAETVA